MKRLINFLVTLFLSVVFLSSCITTNKAYQSSSVISQDVQTDPIKADIRVDDKNKLKGESSASYFLIFKLSGDYTYADGIKDNTSGNVLNSLNLSAMRLNKVRAAAAYNALKSNGTDYDVFVHPTYTITQSNFLNIYLTYKVQVEGYGAKYENFRTEKQKIVMFDNGKELILQDETNSNRTFGETSVADNSSFNEKSNVSNTESNNNSYNVKSNIPFKIRDKVDLTDLLSINGEQTERKIFGAEIYDISDDLLYIRYKFMGETHEVIRNYKTVTKSK